MEALTWIMSAAALVVSLGALTVAVRQARR